jgi:Tol biopolymer transport system component
VAPGKPATISVTARARRRIRIRSNLLKSEGLSISNQTYLTAAALLLAGVLAVPAVRHWRERPPAPVPPAQPLRSTWIAPEDRDAGAGADYSFGLALAPDGRQLAYPAAKDGVVSLSLHDLSTGATRELPGTESGAMPFWSPDTSRIGFFAGGKLRAFELSSGTVSDLADAPAARGGTWNRDGIIVFAPSANGPMMRRDAAGAIAPLTTVDPGDTAHTWPSFLPDGKHVVYLVSSAQSQRAGIWIRSLEDASAPKRLLSGDSQAIVAGTSLLYWRDGALVAHAIDTESLELTGRADTVGVNAGHGPLGQLFATASDEVLIYGPPGTTLRQLRWVARDGTPAGSPSEPIDAWDLRIAPDGRRIAVTEMDRQLRTLDVVIRTGSQPAPARLSLSTDVDESGVWSPDGLRVAWAGQRRKVMVRGAGAVLPEQTIATFDTPVQVWDWSRDGRSLLIGRRHSDNGEDLWIQPPLEGASSTPYAVAPFDQVYGAFSPDGRSVAYASNESGQFDVYVDSYPKPGTRTRVTTAGGTEPRWSNDGRELYFRRGAAIYSVRLNNTLEVESLTQLFELEHTIRAYDVSRDGRFLVNLPAGSRRASAATIITNWKPRRADTEAGKH